MTRSDEDEEVVIEMGSHDPTDDVEQYQLQTGNRVKIPDNWLEHLGIEEGDELLLHCKKGAIEVMEWTRENLSELADDTGKYKE